MSTIPEPAQRLLSEEQVRSVVSLLPAAVYTCDSEGQISFFNRRAEELWGRSPALGTPDELFCGSFRLWRVDGELLPHDQTPMAEALRSGTPCRAQQVVIERPDGSRITVEVNIDPLFDSDGGIAGAVNVFQDVSATRASHEALKASEARYRDLIQALGVAVYTTDANGYITTYNDAAARLWGRRPDEGDQWCGSWRIFTPDGRPLPHEHCPMAVTLREEAPVRDAEIVVERPDGSRAWVLVQPSPLRDADGKLSGAVNVLVDMTALREAERARLDSEENLRDFFDNAAVALHWVGPDGTILKVNRAELDMLGYSEEEYVGRHIADFHVDAPVIEDILARLGAGEVLHEKPARLRCKDGSIKDVLIDSSVLWRDGEFIHTRCFTRDVTEQKAAEESARRTLAVKDQFLSLVSHELRTPISTILGNGLLLLTREERLTQDDKRQAFADIVGEAEKLQENIEHLLLLTRLDSGGLELEPLSLPVLVTRGLDSFKERHAGRAIVVHREEDLPPALGQETLISLVLQNLLTNADKYSPEDEDIDVCLSLNEAGLLEVRVKDRGIGIEEHDMDSMFTPFYRSAKARDMASGLGLGLAVCKRVLEAQGGDIGVDRRPGGGSEFYFLLQPAGAAG